MKTTAKQPGAPFLLAALLLATPGLSDAVASEPEPEGVVWVQSPIDPQLRGGILFPETDPDASKDSAAAPAQFQEPALPSIESTVATPGPASSGGVRFGSLGIGLGLTARRGDATVLRLGARPFGGQATLRAATDAGDLIGRSPAVLQLGLQRRNPVVNDPRVRGSRVGAVAASGSYWTPARVDLDTAVSKLDSRIIERAAVIPGPYSALYGPGFEFIDLQLARAPRYAGGFETHGRTHFDYRGNGQGVYGRQSLWGGDDVWGFRFGYGHRTGNDYESGSGVEIPASYNSRDFDVALGAQLTPTSAMNLNYLRLDQTNVELAGQAFDIDYLVTDGFEVELASQQTAIADRRVVETWYNHTRFEGNAQNPSKRRQFPIYDVINFVGETDVASTSTGYRAAWSWDGVEDESLTIGSDLRFLKQRLNEFVSLDFPGPGGVLADVNSPIPNSDYTNPGLFAEYNSGRARDCVTFRLGARVDLVHTRITADAADLQVLGTSQASAVAILGTDDFDQTEFLGLAYVAMDVNLTDEWTTGASVGYAERAPNLTERYAVEPFMFLIQNGLNTVTGDPLLRKERMIRGDLRLNRSGDLVRGGVTAHGAWVGDYITFVPIGTFVTFQGLEQVNLRYVNTDDATLWGVEGQAECDLTERVTPFLSARYVEGRDQSLGEPLPGILPFESRVGFRLDDGAGGSLWGFELAWRLVAEQDLVAASLFESSTPGFQTLDLRGYWRPRERLQLIAGVENLTDRNYREHLDYRGTSINSLPTLRPGVSGYVGATMEY
ncbi:MAG: TonB-dependent receptor [Planctomycetota bacterium]